MRAIRCKSCGERFYAAVKTDECQNCTGTHDPFAGVAEDAERVRKANKSHTTDKPQAVDPRAGTDAAAKKDKK